MGYKSLSNISIFFLFYTAASRTRFNCGKKNQQLILCSAIEQRAWLAIVTFPLLTFVHK